MIRKNKWILCLVVSFLIPSMANADMLGASAGASYWPAKKSGEISSGGSNINLNSDLNFGNQNLAVLFVSFENPLPVIPNVKLQFFDMAQTTQGTINTSFKSINFTGPVTTTLDMTDYDLTLYYKILDNWVSLDTGVNVKYFSGKIEIFQRNNSAHQTRTNIHQFIPMLYVSAAADLPFTGLSVIGDVSGIGYSGNKIYDASFMVQEQLAVVAFNIGYRKMKLKVNDLSNINVDVDVHGPFVSAMVKF